MGFVIWEFLRRFFNIDRISAIIRGFMPLQPTELEHRISAAECLERIAMPFLLFGAVFSGAFVGSSMVLLPTMTQIEIAGEMHDATELQQYRHELKEGIAQATKKRRQFTDPLSSTRYATLLKKKKVTLSPLDIEQSILQIGHGLQKGTVVLESIWMNATEKTVAIRGDIRNAGPQSMTLLAQFVEDIATLPFVTEVSPPNFTKLKSESIGYYSPFQLTLTTQ